MSTEPKRVDDGCLAFPSHGSMGEVAQDGMTLRQYYAAKALQSLITVHGDAYVPYREMARDAFELADAMLAYEDKT